MGLSTIVCIADHNIWGRAGLPVDLHKQLARDVRSKAERDAALVFLRTRYGACVQGTEWEQLHDEIDQGREIDPSDPVELYEVEGRPVSAVWPDEGMGHAWVWRSDCWKVAPGLVNKSWLEGKRLSRREFAEEFPDADLVALERMLAGELGFEVSSREQPVEAADHHAAELCPLDEFHFALRKAVGTWADQRFGTLAEQLRDQLRGMAPSGIFDRSDHESVWDEFSLQAQHGPAVLDDIWAQIVDPLIDAAIERSPRADAAVLTLWSRWYEDDFADPVHYDMFDPGALRRLVRQRLLELAQQEEQDWVTG